MKMVQRNWAQFLREGVMHSNLLGLESHKKLKKLNEKVFIAIENRTLKKAEKEKKK